MENKKPWQSKTVIFNVIVAVAGILASLGFVPQVSTWINGHSDLIIGAIGAVGVGLRLITKDKISIE